MAARARRDPAAERRELERLREVPEREPVRPELLLERGSEHPRLDAGGARRAIDLEHAVEVREVERDGAAVAPADAAQSSSARTSSSLRGKATTSGAWENSRRSARTTSRNDFP